MHFLVVDDEKDQTALYEYAARTAGVRVSVVNTAYDALKFLGENNYQVDAAILDLGMPYIDGLTLSDNIRLNEKAYREEPLPLFFYTGFIENDAIKKVKERNQITGMFTKTIHTEEFLFREIKNWLKRKPQAAEAGQASPNWLICFVAVIAQIVSVSLFLWLLNKQDVAAAYEFTKMKRQADQYKKTCDTNYLLGTQKDKFIENNDLELPPELSGIVPCILEKEEK